MVNRACPSQRFRSAQKKEIIKAYRKLAQQWHPDNFQDPEEKKQAEKKFIDIAQAKEVLTDPGGRCSISTPAVVLIFSLKSQSPAACLVFFIEELLMHLSFAQK